MTAESKMATGVATHEPVLREACWPDISALSALEERLFPHDAWSESTWWAELAGRPRRDYVVLFSDSHIVGYAGLDHGGVVSDVMTVAVVPDAQGLGLGRLLLDELEARAAARGAASVMLEVRADNTAAIGLYERSGFAVLSTRRRYYQPGDVEALVMRKTLLRREVGDE